ncbi:MAG: 7-carboxy-7-deazaguanine synthase [Hyphomicrobium sp.]
MYQVKEIFYSLQGEGANSGTPAIFCRFSGCNLWSGRESDRQKAVCRFCDTDFVGIEGVNGGRFETPSELVQACLKVCTSKSGPRFVVLTGGEPLLQVDESLIEAFHKNGFAVAVETNGTLPVLLSIDWVCVSPKAGAPLVQTSGDELKLVYPQDGINPEDFLSLDFEHRFLQPMDGPQQQENIKKAIEYCKANPPWRLSLQTQKLLQIP